jgi:Family of unknown function (DUF5670)
VIGWHAAPSPSREGPAGTRIAPFRSGLNIGIEEANMLWTVFVVLLVLWALGFVSGYAIGGFIHLLLVLAVIVLIIQLISGRRSI